MNGNRHFQVGKVARACSGSLVALAVGSAPACLSRPIEPVEPHTTSTITEQLSNQRVDKIDLLLVIDDSGSMADKQAFLARAVPDLVGSLVSPPCLDGQGQASAHPASPLDKCPEGSAREFEPVLDIHIGIISTSLGPRGGTMVNESQCPDRRARLLAGGPPGAPAPATYQDMGFLAWDPGKKLAPPGQGDAQKLVADLESMVRGVGEEGCGLEAQLESWYRFLVDPEPYQSIAVGADQKSQPKGVDQDVLSERRDFLRPDSLVAIVMLTDENDCSFRADGYGHVTANQDLLKELNPEEAKWTNLVCFDQKRRFGHDFLYPVERYVTGLTSPQVPNRQGDLVENPLFVSSDGVLRSRDLVFFAAVVGVPWQDVARLGADGKPSLQAGLKTASEMASDGTWDIVYGDPSKGIAPADPFMIESVEPREGRNPVTGEAVAPPDSPANANAINGHELVVNPAGPPYVGDLQYACIFDLPEHMQRDCDASASHNCDCASKNPSTSNNPLCQDAGGAYGSKQLRAKAFPGLRQLGVLKGIGEQAIVASICPTEVQQEGAPHFGYRPAIAAIVDRLKARLGGPCLNRQLDADENGQVACLILEGRHVGESAECGCKGAARLPVAPEHMPAQWEAQESLAAQGQKLDCFCEIEQLAGEGLAACQAEAGSPEAGGQPVDGWCYVDAAMGEAAAELVARCPAAERRTIRFVGEGEAANHSTLFITCQQSSE
ncbi:MAG: hypothetical protein HY744_27635 [Deltaproteobacteria bacterium]|nr:hypothetical protein [Deltaproteobacteria bacterium]